MGLPELSEGPLLAPFLFGLLKHGLSLEFLELDGQHDAYHEKEKDHEVTARPHYQKNGSLAKLFCLVLNEVLQEHDDGADDRDGDTNDKQESEHRHPLLLIRKEGQRLLAVVLADQEETDEFQGLHENKGKYKQGLL